MLFSLDVFEPGLSAQEIAIGLFMHNIPALILAVVVAISWKREIVGGIVFISAGTLYVVMILMNIIKNPSDFYMLFWTLQISVPAFLIGSLFIVNWVKKRKI
jgi:peptidoglycan/LPS O-acetylase OafA/YrhL